MLLTFSIVAQNNDILKFKNLNMGYEDHNYGASTHNEGKIFALPDTTSKVVWEHKIPFSSYILPLAKTTINGIEWFRVNTFKGRDTITGYLRQSDFVKYTFRNGDTHYCIINDKGTNGGQNFKVIKKTKNSLDTLVVGSPSHYLRAKYDYYKMALPNVVGLVNLEFFRASCPGTTINVLVVDCGDSLTTLATSAVMGESTWYESTIVYVPVKFGSGKVLLVANGDVKNIFNGHTAELNTYPYPKDCKVPIEELVVVVSEAAESEESNEVDENGFTIEQEPKVNLHKEVYYQWKNNTLVKVSEK